MNISKLVKFLVHFSIEEILFDYSGWNHLVKDGDGKFRNQQNMEERLKLIPLLPQLLSLNISPIEPRIKIRNNLVVKYFSWIFTIDTELEIFRIKIIVRQKGENQKHFYSCFKLIHYKFPKNNSPDGASGNA